MLSPHAIGGSHSLTEEEINAIAAVVARAVAEELKKDAPAEWITVPQAAEHIGKSPTDVYKMIRAGEIPAYHVSERSVRVDRVELDRYLRTRKAI